MWHVAAIKSEREGGGGEAVCGENWWNVCLFSLSPLQVASVFSEREKHTVGGMILTVFVFYCRLSNTI